ncbi:MAG: phosphoglycerate dehydrogenase [Sporolactobacillus sp.]
MKVLFCVGKSYYPFYELIVEKLQQCGAEVTCLMYRDATKANLIRHIGDADIYITAIAAADREVIDAAPRLKYILKMGTGLDNVDLNYASSKGIVVSNAPGANAPAVAELAVGLMIALSRQIPQMDQSTKQGEWMHGTGFELQGKTLGIIGFGTIGTAVARLARGFSMNSLAYGKHRDTEAAERLDVHFATLDELLVRSDYIVISTASRPDNYHLIGAAALGKMKPTAFLINISRGALIDEHALFAALRDRRIGGAALDVLEHEPPEAPPPALDHLIVTPHIGGTTKESVRRVALVTIDNIRRYINSEPLNYVANPGAISNSHRS